MRYPGPCGRCTRVSVAGRRSQRLASKSAKNITDVLSSDRRKACLRKDNILSFRLLLVG